MTKSTGQRTSNMCAICGKRISLESEKERSSRWIRGDVFGISQVMFVHTDCYFAKLDALQEARA